MTTLKRALSCLFLLPALGLAACADGEGQPERPPVAVSYITVDARDIPLAATLTGRTVAYETSEVRPQINGHIRRRLFTEGSFVRAGQPLYQIDASMYQAAANQAEANLASARASADAAIARAERLRPLAEMEAVSQQEYTDADAAARVARAAIAQNEAALETARLNLRYTTISAPISGRIGRSAFTVGALVSANQADPLAVIQRIDPIYVDIQQSSAEMTTMQQALAEGALQEGSTSVRLELEDGSAYPLSGTIQFSEMVVNPGTGSVTLRARFPNPDGLLLPGMFVRAMFEQAVQPGALLVPQPAIRRDFDGSAYLFVIGPDDKAVRRRVTADRAIGTDWVVTSGLQAGDRVITQGIDNLRHDDAVRASPANARSAPARPADATSARTGQPAE